MKKFTLKMVIDIILVLAMIALMCCTITGLLVHEIMGLGIFVMFVVHNILNIGAVKKEFYNITHEDIPVRVRIGSALNFILAVDFTTVTVTGIAISSELFNFRNLLDNPEMWVAIHNSASWLGLILISVHVGLHWSMIKGFFKKVFNVSEKHKFAAVCANVFTLALMALGIKGMVDNNVAAELVKPLNTNTNNASKSIDENNSQTQINVEKRSLSSSNSIKQSKEMPEFSSNSRSSGKHGGKNSQFTPSAVNDGEALEDYLTRLTCTGCGKHCPLSAPQCMTGENNAATATTYYYEQNNTQSDSNQNVEEAQSSESASSNSDNHNDKYSQFTPSAVNDGEALEDYLTRLTCTGCGKHCPLSAPQCMTGENNAATATTYYYEQNDIQSDEIDETNETEQLENSTTETETIDNNNDKYSQFTPSAVNDGEALEDYLTRLTCTGCGKHCLLSAPQCMTGENNASTATAYYYEQTGQVNQNSTDFADIASDIAGKIGIISLFAGSTHYTASFLSRKKKNDE